MSLTDDIKEMFSDSILLGKKAIVADIKIQILKQNIDEVSTKELFVFMDSLIEREERERGKNI